MHECREPLKSVHDLPGAIRVGRDEEAGDWQAEKQGLDEARLVGLRPSGLALVRWGSIKFFLFNHSDQLTRRNVEVVDVNGAALRVELRLEFRSGFGHGHLCMWRLSAQRWR